MLGLVLNVQHHQQLRRAKCDVPINFLIQLKTQKKPLVLKQCLRVLPGKRVVALADWQGETVIAKIFFHPRHSVRHIEREKKGLTLLNHALIASPKLILSDQCEQDSAIQILLIERIFPADNFYDIWLQAQHSPRKSEELIKNALSLMADLHAYQLLQVDFHLQNLLVKSGKVFMIDMGMLRRCRFPIRRRVAIYHLARFLAQFPFESDETLTERLQWYATCRQWQINPRETVYLQKSVRYWLHHRFKDLNKKLFRNATQFVRYEQNHLTVVIDRTYDEPHFIEQFLAIYQGGLNDQFASIRIPIDWFSRKTKATWRLLHQLTLYGIPCPKPIAILYPKSWRGLGVVITEQVKGIPLGEFNGASAHQDTIDCIHQQEQQVFTRLSLLNKTLTCSGQALVVFGETLLFDPKCLRCVIDKSFF